MQSGLGDYSVPKKGSRRSQRPSRRSIVAWLFVLPVLLLHLLVVMGPTLSAFYYSLTDWRGLGEASFVGLANFRKLLFHDLTFRLAFRHNLAWTLFFLTIPFVLALVAASLLARVRRGAMLFRIGLFIPYVLPSVVIASVWRYLLSPDTGLPAVLRSWGVAGFDKALLGQPSTALYTVAFVDNWHYWGFLMVLFLAAMQGIPADLYEAARLDGANRWHEFIHVTIPGIRPTLVYMLLMTAIWSMLTFDYIWILTQGGPGGATEVMSTFVFKAFTKFEAGYAAAAGLTMSFFAGLIVLLFVWLRRRGWEI